MGDAEVGEDDPVVRPEQHIGRFHIPVHDAHGVRGAQGAEDGEADPGGLGGVQGAAPEQLVQRLAAHQLHDDPRQPVLLLGDDVVDGDGGGMLDAGGGAGLPVEPVGGPLEHLVLGVAGQPRLLHGDFALDQLVERAPHRAHAAGADAFEEAVTPAHHPRLGAPADPVFTHAPCLPCAAGASPVQRVLISRPSITPLATSRPRSVKSPLPG